MRTRAKSLTVSGALTASFALLVAYGVPALAETGGEQVLAEVEDPAVEEPEEPKSGDAEEPASEEESQAEVEEEADDEGGDADAEKATEAAAEAEAEKATAEDGAHGEFVSAVAACAPNGRAAKDAGLPNHGTFVSAAAKGEEVSFMVDSETFTANMASLDGEAFCAFADGLPSVEDETADAVESEGETSADDDEPKPAKAEKPEKGDRGRSADAPGKQKKNG